MAVEILTKEQLEKVKFASKIVAQALEYLKDFVKPGATAWDLEMAIRDWLKKNYPNARPAFYGYRGYPAYLCVSVNEEVVHGIPRKDRVLKEGDIVSIDFGVEYEGFYGDSAKTFKVGKVSKDIERLLEGTEKALYNAIEEVYAGNKLENVARAIYKTLKKYRLHPICKYGGHGIGTKLHSEPFVANCPGVGPKMKLKEGMVLAIEPMAGLKTAKTMELADGWTVITWNKTPAAHFEHTVAITENGPEILSLPD
ncbi:MAG: type I methionyl aminopeptidase [Gammaproteobacteria bacterium]|nr:MAG: type I methionyl aminopeptidase [Gammaproteobacteria bacterium]